MCFISGAGKIRIAADRQHINGRARSTRCILNIYCGDKLTLFIESYLQYIT